MNRWHSENDILLPHHSHSFVRQPCLCWNYDSLCGMQCRVPWWHLSVLRRDNNCNTAKQTGVLTGHSPPRVSHAILEASPPQPPPPPPLCSPRSGHKVLSYSHQTVWLEAAADVTVFSFPPHSVFSLSPTSCQCRLPGRLACEVLKSWKKRGPWKRSWSFGFCTSWIAFFIFFAFTAKSTK